MPAFTGSPARITRALRAAPATVPALAVVVVLIVWAANDAGYPVTHWAPGALVVLALLAITAASVPLSLGSVPRPVLIALGCLALYTAFSYLSILWAGVPGDAWEGANRTLLYLLVFALFASWPQRGSSAALLLCTWTAAMIGLGAFVVVHIASASQIGALFGGGRLKYPAGYENAAAATWAMVAWPALLLARSRSIPWPVRGVLGGGAVLLADLALLSQSRGALYATPVMLILVFAFVGGRVRTFATLVPIAVGIGLTVPGVLRVRDRLLDGGDAKAALHSASVQMFIAALAVGLIVALAAALEARRPVSPELARRLHRGVGALALATLAVLLIGGWVAAGDPVKRARHAWDTFKSGSGYAANGNGSRLTSGLGSNRYDFYRVALDEFVAHPLGGIGADNFQEPYLAHGRSDETPRYPHSVELRTLSETGLAGSALALAGLAAALFAGWRGLRRPDPLASTVTAAALAGFAYWLVHGSFDWFWEFAGLGAPAFALLGIACALAPRSRPAAVAMRGAAHALPLTAAHAEEPEDDAAARPVVGRAPQARFRAVGAHALPTWRALGIGAAAAVALVAAVSLAAPYLSALEVQRAVSSWSRAPRRAYSELDDAARLDPLSDEADVTAGSIALRFGDLASAEHYFRLARGRTPGDAYATLELGAIASASGHRAVALALLTGAVRLSPREGLAREALALVKAGGTVDIDELNHSILVKAQQLA